MTRKTIFEWAELFQEDVSNGASQSDIVQMLEDYKTEQLTIPVVSGINQWTCDKCGTVPNEEVTFEETHDGCGGYCS